MLGRPRLRRKSESYKGKSTIETEQQKEDDFATTVLLNDNNNQQLNRRRHSKQSSNYYNILNASNQCWANRSHSKHINRIDEYLSSFLRKSRYDRRTTRKVSLVEPRSSITTVSLIEGRSPKFARGCCRPESTFSLQTEARLQKIRAEKTKLMFQIKKYETLNIQISKEYESSKLQEGELKDKELELKHELWSIKTESKALYKLLGKSSTYLKSISIPQIDERVKVVHHLQIDKKNNYTECIIKRVSYRRYSLKQYSYLVLVSCLKLSFEEKAKQYFKKTFYRIRYHVGELKYVERRLIQLTRIISTRRTELAREGLRAIISNQLSRLLTYKEANILILLKIRTECKVFAQLKKMAADRRIRPIKLKSLFEIISRIRIHYNQTLLNESFSHLKNLITNNFKLKHEALEFLAHIFKRRYKNEVYFLFYRLKTFNKERRLLACRYNIVKHHLVNILTLKTSFQRQQADSVLESRLREWSYRNYGSARYEVLAEILKISRYVTKSLQNRVFYALIREMIKNKIAKSYVMLGEERRKNAKRRDKNLACDKEATSLKIRHLETLIGSLFTRSSRIGFKYLMKTAESRHKIIRFVKNIDGLRENREIGLFRDSMACLIKQGYQRYIYKRKTHLSKEFSFLSSDKYTQLQTIKCRYLSWLFIVISKRHAYSSIKSRARRLKSAAIIFKATSVYYNIVLASRLKYVWRRVKDHANVERRISLRVKGIESRVFQNTLVKEYKNRTNSRYLLILLEGIEFRQTIISTNFAFSKLAESVRRERRLRLQYVVKRIQSYLSKSEVLKYENRVGIWQLYKKLEQQRNRLKRRGAARISCFLSCLYYNLKRYVFRNIALYARKAYQKLSSILSIKKITTRYYERMVFSAFLKLRMRNMLKLRYVVRTEEDEQRQRYLLVHNYVLYNYSRWYFYLVPENTHFFETVLGRLIFKTMAWGLDSIKTYSLGKNNNILETSSAYVYDNNPGRIYNFRRGKKLLAQIMYKYSYKKRRKVLKASLEKWIKSHRVYVLYEAHHSLKEAVLNKKYWHVKLRFIMYKLMRSLEVRSLIGPWRKLQEFCYHYISKSQVKILLLNIKTCPQGPQLPASSYPECLPYTTIYTHLPKRDLSPRKQICQQFLTTFNSFFYHKESDFLHTAFSKMKTTFQNQMILSIEEVYKCLNRISKIIKIHRTNNLYQLFHISSLRRQRLVLFRNVLSKILRVEEATQRHAFQSLKTYALAKTIMIERSQKKYIYRRNYLARKHLLYTINMLAFPYTTLASCVSTVLNTLTLSYRDLTIVIAKFAELQYDCKLLLRTKYDSSRMCQDLYRKVSTQVKTMTRMQLFSIRRLYSLFNYRKSRAFTSIKAHPGTKFNQEKNLLARRIKLIKYLYTEVNKIQEIKTIEQNIHSELVQKSERNGSQKKVVGILFGYVSQMEQEVTELGEVVESLMQYNVFLSHRMDSSELYAQRITHRGE